MKTTFVLAEPLFRRLKERALETGRTLSYVVEELLARGLAAPSAPAKTLPKLPILDVGRILVDPSNRSALHEAIAQENDERLYGGKDRGNDVRR